MDSQIDRLEAHAANAVAVFSHEHSPKCARPAFRFAGFEIDPGRRSLMEDGQQLRLGSRAFDLLVALCQRHGEVVATAELLAAAWPHQVVEESSVRVHIAALRKVLRDGQANRRYITNVPLRGYCLVAPVEVMVEAPIDGDLESAAPPPVATAPPMEAGRQWQAGWSGLVGRDEESAELLQRLQAHQCVTLVGAGGIGKTSVALPVARRFGEIEGADVVVVELGTLTQEHLVPTAVASSLGLVIADGRPPLAAIAAFLGSKRRQLIVLDNCEHVIDGVAALVEHVLAHAPDTCVLATSRESLRVQGEWVQRLESLALPPPNLQGCAAEALKYAAVQLFCQRAAAGASAFAMDDADAPLVGNICRRLDGIPLAIELAAGAIETVGLKGLVERLGGRLGSRLVMTGRGRRTALPRHQTLRATLDWSFSLLPLEEQQLLAHLSVFRGVFTHAAALAVFDRPLEDLDVSLAALVGKSLVVSERSGDTVVYRLLETMREYAAERLAADPNGELAPLRHAKHLLSKLRQDRRDDGGLAPSSALASTARELDDVRAAIHWAMGSETARPLAVSLVAWSGPLWFSMAMLSEYRQLAERAVALIDAHQGVDATQEEEMRLCESLGHAIWHTWGGGDAIVASFNRALVIADRLEATAFRLRCRWGLWLACNAAGDYDGSRRQAEQFGDIAVKNDDPSVLTHERMMALGMHFQGDQIQAKLYASRVLKQPVAKKGATRSRGFHFDHRVAGLTVMARVLWLEGRPDQALQYAIDAVEESVSIAHPLSLCYAVAIGAAPVAFWCGEIDKARAWSALLTHTAHERSLHFWQAYGDGFQHLLDRSHPVPSFGGESTDARGITLRETLSTIEPAFFDNALLQRALRMQSGWCTAELLRIHGERQRHAGALEEATSTLRRSLDVAAQQHARSWTLRTSISLARLLVQDGRLHEARATLEHAVRPFDEGHATSDVKLALHVIANELQ